MSMFESMKKGWFRVIGDPNTHNIDGIPVARTDYEEPITMPEDGGCDFGQPRARIGDIRLTRDNSQEYFDGKRWIKQDPSSPVSMLKCDINALSARLHNAEALCNRMEGRISELENKLERVLETGLAENEGSHLV